MDESHRHKLPIIAVDGDVDRIADLILSICLDYFLTLV
jgi:hypothetical protein